MVALCTFGTIKIISRPTWYQITNNSLGTRPQSTHSGPARTLSNHWHHIRTHLIHVSFFRLPWAFIPYGLFIAKRKTHGSRWPSQNHSGIPAFQLFFRSQHVKDTRGIMKPRLGTVVLGQLCSPSDSFARKKHVLFTHHPRIVDLCRTRRVC